MELSKNFSKLPLGVFAAFLLVLATASTAFAHVTVKPGEVKRYQRYADKQTWLERLYRKRRSG
jgi:hypothetical protein